MIDKIKTENIATGVYERTAMQHTIIDTGDQEFNAVLFIELAVRDFDPTVKWRILDFANARIRRNTYGDENVAQGSPTN